MLDNNWRVFAALVAALVCPGPALASFLPISESDHAGKSHFVVRGVVESVASYKEKGVIWSTATVRVIESRKGSPPERLEFIFRGGQVGSLAQGGCSTPSLSMGEEHVLYLSRGKSGKLELTRGAESAVPVKSKASKRLHAPAEVGPSSPSAMESSVLMDSTTPHFGFGATNLMSHARFLQPDGGGRIPYIVDNDFLPASITISQAMWAVSTALNAWTNVCSVRFQFAGIQSFGMPAENVAVEDGALRIQLHDAYGALPAGGELGEGGRTWYTQTSPSGWTTGGSVAGNDFHKVGRGYITLKHTAASMNNLATFTEVLAHEIGHAIGLGHSSQNYPEPNATLREAIMYWLVHADGRGASLTSWDISVCRQIHPFNTPPVSFDRYMDVVSTPQFPLNVPGVNQVQVPAYDLQSPVLSVQMANPSVGMGTFSLSGSNITLVPNAYYGNAARVDPSTGSSYGYVYSRVSDGTNNSPFTLIQIASINQDSYNEGVPDWWRSTWFGSPNPNSGINHKANDDADGDGFTNIREWWLRSDPTDQASNLRLAITPSNLVFDVLPYEVFEIFRLQNGATWVRDSIGFVPTGSPATPAYNTNAASGIFRVRRLP